jgi:hypothetical protein
VLYGEARVKEPQFGWRVESFDAVSERVNEAQEVTADNREMEQFSPTREDCIRMAAFIDGEGSIYLKKYSYKGKSGSGSLELMVCNTDPRMSQWCQVTFGGRVIRVSRNRWKPLFRWIVSGPKAETVIRQCLEFFLIKREQADLALAYRATFARRSQCRIPNDIQESRQQMREQMHAMKDRWTESTVVN